MARRPRNEAGTGRATIGRDGFSIVAALLVLAAANVAAPDAADARRRGVREPHAPTGAKAAEPAVPAPAALPEPPIPVVQARAVGLDACGPVLDLMSRQILTSKYDAQSGWSRIDPSRHVFQTVAALTRPGNTPPDGITALIAAPVTAGGCDGVALQVFPLAGDCQSAQKVIMRGGRIVAPLLNTRIMQDSGGNRLFLLPGFSKTCIAIAVDSHFGQP